jgi:hypothetical protein
VAALMARIGARDHALFGGRLARDAQGFPASAMAKTHAGDWRDFEQIREWARVVAHAIANTSAVEMPAPPPAPRHGVFGTLALFVGTAVLCGVVIELVVLHTVHPAHLFFLVLAVSFAVVALRMGPASPHRARVP